MSQCSGQRLKLEILGVAKLQQGSPGANVAAAAPNADFRQGQMVQAGSAPAPPLRMRPVSPGKGPKQSRVRQRPEGQAGAPAASRAFSAGAAQGDQGA